MAERRETTKRETRRSTCMARLPAIDRIHIWLYLCRIRGVLGRDAASFTRRVPRISLLMAKRRTIIDSDDEQDGNQASPSSAKRSRLETKDHQSSKSKGKGKAREDHDILNDFRVDEEDDIASIRDVHAEEDEGFQERFEEEHEESIRESIRQRNKQQGVGSSFCLVPSP